MLEHLVHDSALMPVRGYHFLGEAYGPQPMPTFNPSTISNQVILGLFCYHHTLNRQEVGIDVGFPSVYHWLIKNLPWAYYRTESSKAGIPRRDREESRQRQGEAM